MLFYNDFIATLGFFTAVFLAATFGLEGENFLNMPSMSIFFNSFWFSPFALGAGIVAATCSSTSV